MSDQQQMTILEQSGAVQRAPSILEIFAQLARDPTVNVADIKQLMELQKWAEEREAEKQFTAAFARLKFPPIKKTSKGHNSKYAPFEEIQEIVDPILAGEGFTLTFSSAEPTAQGIPIKGKLSHVGGHSELGMLTLPRDKSGSMNDIQGAGSTISYGQRYLAKMMLNLRFIGEDDDAGFSSRIDEQGVNNIINLIADCEMTAEMQKKFLKWLNIEKIESLLARDYEKAYNFLTAKAKERCQGVSK